MPIPRPKIKLELLVARIEALRKKGEAHDDKLFRLELQIEVEKLISSISEAQTKLVEADRIIRHIRDAAHEELSSQIQVIIEAFLAKNKLPFAVVKDIFSTLASLQPSVISISPKYKYTEEQIRKAWKKGKQLSPDVCDKEDPVMMSPFGSLEEERMRISQILSSLRPKKAKREFQSLFSEAIDNLHKISVFHKKLKSGQSLTAIKQYYLQAYAATFFKAHVEERAKTKKGVVRQLARYVCETLEIDYPLKSSIISLVIKDNPPIKILLDTVIKRELSLAVDLDKQIAALSKRPLSARPDQSKKGIADRRKRPDPTFLSMISAPATPSLTASSGYDTESEMDEDEFELSDDEVIEDSEDEIPEDIQEGKEETLPFKPYGTHQKIGLFHSSSTRHDKSRIVSKDMSSKDPLSRRLKKNRAEKKFLEQDAEEIEGLDSHHGPGKGHKK
jgi:hypothetical protein